LRRKTIYLHIGTPKTGTTSIQGYLASNEEQLYAEGYLLPKVSRNNHNSNHIKLTNYALNEDRSIQIRVICKTNTKKEVLEFREQFYQKLRAEIKEFSGDYVILSNEHCYRSLTNHAEISRLKDLFDGLADQIKVIVYLREQSDMLCSRYSTELKNNNTNKIKKIESFRDFDFLDYNQRLKAWEEVFGIENITLKIFDRGKLYQGDVISDFCNTLNMPRYDYQPVFLNTSLNAKQAEFLRIINTHIGKLEGKKGIRIRHQLNLLVTQTHIESPSVSALINKDYLDVYDESNKELAKRYFHQEIELFNKKDLNDFALDQTAILTEADAKNLATQIIEKNGKDYEMLCKCIAAIFDVPYKNKRIPMTYVQGFKVSDYDKKRRKKIAHWSLLVKKIRLRIINK
jgi:hypothetical protein